MAPFMFRWRPRRDEKYRKKIAAARHLLLSEFFEATTGMVMLPGLGDPQRGGVPEEIPAMLPWFPWYEPSEGEKIYGAIEELRHEILVYKMRCKKSWDEEYRLAKKLEPVLDGASNFLSAGKTTLHGHAQITKGRDTQVVSHEAEDSLDALFDGMIQFSEKTSPKTSVDIMNVSYPLYFSNFIYCSRVHLAVVQLGRFCRSMEFVTVPYSVTDRYESGDISENPKPQSANTGSAFKDVHGLIDSEPENRRMGLSSIRLADKMELQQWRYVTLLSWATGLSSEIMPVLSLKYDHLPPSLRHLFAHFPVVTAHKGCVNKKIGSYQIPLHSMFTDGNMEYEFGSVRRPLVQMVLFAHTLYAGTLACLKSIVPKSIVNLYESGRIFEKPKPQSTNPNVDDLTDAEPENFGAPDSGDRRICRNIEAEGKTAATWLIDTGAVHHATGKLSLMSDITTETNDDLFITARDGIRMRVHAQGSVITDTVVLPDVWYIPGLTKNVVSASQLNQLGYSIGFTRGRCFIRSATDGTLIGKGYVSEDGLFETDFLKVS